MVFKRIVASQYSMLVSRIQPSELSERTESSLIRTGKEAFDSVGRKDIVSHLRDVDKLFLAHEDRLIGYGGARYNPGEVELAGSFIHPSYQHGWRSQNVIV